MPTGHSKSKERNSRVAAYLRGDRLALRHCGVSDASTEGISIIASSDVLREKNIFTRNNIENITGYYPATVKIFSAVRMYQNTLVNSTVTIARNARAAANDAIFGWHSSTGPDVEKRDGHVFVNNLLAGEEKYRRPLLFVWQPDSLCRQLGMPQLKQVDHTTFVQRSESNVLIVGSPANNRDCQMEFESLEGFQKMYPVFSAHRRSSGGTVPAFKSRELGITRCWGRFRDPAEQRRYRLT
jgi:hypothetical protein